jgi:hypothetical protein
MASRPKKRPSPDDNDDNDSNVIANGGDKDLSRRTKKTKTSKNPNTLQDPSSSLSLSKRPGDSPGGGESYQTDSNGDPYWEISQLRRVTVSSFKGRTMVNVREYYEKGGLELPGKKVSSLFIIYLRINFGGHTRTPDEEFGKVDKTRHNSPVDFRFLGYIYASGAIQCSRHTTSEHRGCHQEERSDLGQT